MEKQRCPWCLSSEKYIKYHDEEWGKPVHDDAVHFEFLVLESAQAGLSWITVLNKRENYRKSYDGFDVKKAAQYGPDKIKELMANEGVIRNLKKIEASINNAVRFIEIQQEFGSFDKYIWNFTGFKPIVNKWKTLSELPPFSALSDNVARDMKKRGFKFLGSTVMYAHLQAVGIINDHLIDCFRYKQILKLS